MKKIFGFDLDGVLYYWHVPVYDYLKRYKGEQRSFQQFWQDAIDGKDGYNELFWENIVRIPIIYEKLPANMEDVYTLQELSNDYTIIYLSHRPKSMYRTTKNWLKRYGFPNVEHLYLTTKPKDVAVRLYDVDLYIEDRPKILQSELRNITTLIAMRTLWNWKECETLPYVDYIRELPELVKTL